MQRLEQVRVQGFKCFDDLSLSLGQLTLLSGINGGGKSTIIQSMLLVSQGLRGKAGSKSFPLNGELVRLGSIGDIVGSSRDRSPKFSFLSKEGGVDWVFKAQASGRFLLLTKISSQDSNDSEIVGCLKNLVFIGASRGGERTTYPMRDSKPLSYATVGIDGRYAAQSYYDQVDDEVTIEKRFPGEQSLTFRRQMNAWLSSLFPGAEANVQFFREAQQFGLQFRLSSTSAWVHPSNIGYGFSYGFPILVALLSALPGQLIIIDSPEAHLHPLAQSQMGRLLASLAQAGAQVLVETHSDHLLNGVRLAVKEGIISTDDLGVHFFSGPEGDNHGVQSPKIDRYGLIDDWPLGFFDQSERDLLKLADLD